MTTYSVVFLSCDGWTPPWSSCGVTYDVGIPHRGETRARAEQQGWVYGSIPSERRLADLCPDHAHLVVDKH